MGAPPAPGQLRRRGWGPVEPAFVTAARPSVAEAVACARREGASRVAIASYLLGPGRFSRALHAAVRSRGRRPAAPSPWGPDGAEDH